MASSQYGRTDYSSQAQLNWDTRKIPNLRVIPQTRSERIALKQCVELEIGVCENYITKAKEWLETLEREDKLHPLTQPVIEETPLATKSVLKKKSVRKRPLEELSRQMSTSDVDSDDSSVSSESDSETVTKLVMPPVKASSPAKKRRKKASGEAEDSEKERRRKKKKKHKKKHEESKKKHKKKKKKKKSGEEESASSSPKKKKGPPKKRGPSGYNLFLRKKKADGVAMKEALVLWRALTAELKSVWNNRALKERAEIATELKAESVSPKKKRKKKSSESSQSKSSGSKSSRAPQKKSVAKRSSASSSPPKVESQSQSQVLAKHPYLGQSSDEEGENIRM